MSSLIAKYILGRLLFVAWFFLTCSPALALAWLRDRQDDKTGILTWLTALWGLGSLIASWWLGSTTAHYKVDEKLMFLDAVKRTWLDGRLRLAFIPIIGVWFTPDEDKTKYDDDDEIHSHRFD